MERKRIFILDGHPAAPSLNGALAQSYCDAAVAAGHEVRLVHLSDLTFDPDFGLGGYDSWKPLEPDLEAVMDHIRWCTHFVMATPMWWGGLPAVLKGFFDRAFLPGTAFDTRNPSKFGLPAPMLSGRSARVILTSDTPGWYLRLAYGRPMIRNLRGQVLGFVGIKPVRVTYFSGASHPKEAQVQGWLDTVAALGARGD